MVTEELQEKDARIVAIELILAKTLRIGSIIAAILLALGIGAFFFGGAVLAPKLITAGILVLLCTPVMRVIAAGVIFIKEGEYHFALFSLVVLCALLIGAILGRGGA